MTPEQEMDHVIDLVNQINSALMGEDVAVAQSALTIAVIAAIVHTTSTQEERVKQTRGFAQQVAEYAQRDDFIAWIKKGIIQSPQLTPRKQ